MEKYLPLFPLNLVAFPGEELNLHVFEPRYKQLVKDILHDSPRTFGIPAFLNDTIAYGTEMELIKVAKVYPDERMDIVTRGLHVFEVLEYNNPMADKLYAGGQVAMKDNIRDEEPAELKQLHGMVQQLFNTLNMVKEVHISENVSSFDIGHKIGLSIEQEYELLKINRESERIHFIVTHLERAIPILQDIERTKKRIQMNGHFKHFDPLDF